MHFVSDVSLIHMVYQKSQPSYYMKLINVHDVEVSISAWVSHAMPFNRKFVLDDSCMSMDLCKRLVFAISLKATREVC